MSSLFVLLLLVLSRFFLICVALSSLHLSLHDALPIFHRDIRRGPHAGPVDPAARARDRADAGGRRDARSDPAHDRVGGGEDRKSTRLNSSHLGISYAVCCLKKTR